MLMGKAQNVVGHSPELVRKFALDHNSAYQHCDIDVLMASTSPRGGIWAGLLPPDNFVIHRDPEDVRASYVELIRDFKVLPPRVFTMIATDWYACFEVTSQMIHKPSGQVFDNQAVCLFGNDELATTVDMAWPFGPTPGASRPKRDLKGELRSELIDVTAHEERLESWRTADSLRGSHGVAEKGAFFLPVFDPGDERLAVGLSSRADYQNHLDKLFAVYDVKRIAPLNLHVGDQYVFSETHWSGTARKDAAPFAFRYALVEILNSDGEISAMLGFATLAD